MPVPNSIEPEDDQIPACEAWRGILDEFRALGGVAENIVLRPSPIGRGVFAENPGQPVRLLVPDNLLIRPRDIALRGENIGVADDAETEHRSRAFFERYQARLSWGGGGRAQGAALVDMFDSLDTELRNRLAADFGMAPFIEGDRGERILRYFLRSRAVRRGRETWLAPFFDRLNRGGSGLPVASGPAGGVQIEGKAQGELLLAWDHFDSLDIFKRHGIAVPRDHAFSLPMRTKAGTVELVIGRDLTANTQRPGFRAPQMRAEAETVHLSYLTVGNASFPRIPRGIFYALMREARVARAEGAFDRILFVNRAKFLSLLGLLEPLRGELVSRLRSMVHFQLAALAECLGAREL